MQPGPELAVAAEPGESLPGGQERVLGGALRVLVIVQHGERDMIGTDGVTAHELIEGLQVTLPAAPDQLLARRPLAGPWARLVRPGTAVPCRNQPDRPGHEIASGKQEMTRPPRAVTAVSGPSRLDCDTKTTTVTLQAPPVQAMVPATRVRGSTEHVRTSEHMPATACIY